MTNEQLCNECLEELFRRVGRKYPDEEFTTQPDWYMQETWTQAEEEDFRKWMLKKLGRMYRKETEVAMFLLMWGWKNKEDDDDK